MSRYLIATGQELHYINKHLKRYLPNAKFVSWPEFQKTSEKLSNNFDYLINLNGSPIFGSDDSIFPGKLNKETVTKTRIQRAEILQEFVVKDNSIQKFVQISSTSAYNYQELYEKSIVQDEYTSGEVITTVTPQGIRQTSTGNTGHFFQQLAWDVESLAKSDKTCCVRVGNVLGDGGMLQRQQNLAKKGLIFRIGGSRFFWRHQAGEHLYPWIHANDLARLLIFLAESDEKWPIVNGVSPDVITQLDYVNSLRNALDIPSFIPPIGLDVVSWRNLKWVLRDIDRTELCSKGMHIVPRIALNSGFEYEFENISSALQDLCKK